MRCEFYVKLARKLHRLRDEMEKEILSKEVHPRSLVKTHSVWVGVSFHSRAMGNFYPLVYRGVKRRTNCVNF